MTELTNLNNHHRDTISQIFVHPTSHNIQWKDVGSLLGAIGEIEEKHDGRVKVTLGGDIKVFNRPKNKDVETDDVVELRHFLRNAGYDPVEFGKPRGTET